MDIGGLMILVGIILSVLLLLFYGYQLALILAKDGGRVAKNGALALKMAILIPARDEESVVGRAVASVRASNYPEGKLSVFVLADNCTDATGREAERAGATVFKRSSDKKGKGYALGFLLSRVMEIGEFDAYVILDADNTVSPDFLSNINNVLSSGYDVAVGARVPRDMDNTVGALSGLLFLYEGIFLNRGRHRFSGMPFALGTGFAFTDTLACRMGGWRFFLMTEDYEMCAYMALNGVRVGYSDNAVFYDPQPYLLSDSRFQRMRWARGGAEVLIKYLPSLLRSLFSKPTLALYDVTMSFCPAFMIGTALAVMTAVGTVSALIGRADPTELFVSILIPLGTYYSLLLSASAYMLIREKRIERISVPRKILYSALFPLFVFSFLPLGVLSVLKKRISWRKMRRIRGKKHGSS